MLTSPIHTLLTRTRLNNYNFGLAPKKISKSTRTVNREPRFILRRMHGRAKREFKSSGDIAHFTWLLAS